MNHNRFILKSGVIINHDVSPTVARKIHDNIFNKSVNSIQLEDQYGNVTATIEVSEIAAYIQL